MIFTAGDIDAFLQVSGDTNPLHSDYDFARMSGFDGRVVPGVLSALSAIRNRGTMRTIRAKFASPIYSGIDYPLGCTGRFDRFWFGGQNDKRAVIWLDGTVFVNRNFAAYGESITHGGDYCVQSGDMFWQHLAMHWIGWFTGTCVPGAGGILAQFEMEFSTDNNPIVGCLSYQARVKDVHKELGVIAVDASVRSGDLEALCSVTAFRARSQ